MMRAWSRWAAVPVLVACGCATAPIAPGEGHEQMGSSMSRADGLPDAG